MESAAAIASSKIAPRRRRPGTIDLYLLRSLSAPFLLVLGGAFAAMMLERALRLVQELAASGADISYFLPLLARLAPYYLNLALPVAFFAAIALLIARLDDSLEIEAMLASGLSFGRIALPLIGAGGAVALVALAVGGWIEPQGRHAFRVMKAEAVNAGRIGRLPPRAIYVQDQAMMLTVERRTGTGVAGLLVWQQLPDGRERVLTARAGRIGFDAGRRSLVVSLHGGRYAEASGAAEPRVFGFDSVALHQPVQLGETQWPRGWDQKEMTLPELVAAIGDGSSRIAPHVLAAELYSRLARCLTIPLLPLLALPFAVTVKKERRGLGLLLVGLLLIAFHHAVNSTRSLGVAGAVDPLIGMLAVTGLFAAITLLLFRSGRWLPSHSPVADALRPIARVPAAIRPRRAGAAGGRGAIGAYVRSTLLRHFGLALVACVAILQLVEFVERGDDFVVRGLGAADAAYHVWLRLPAMTQQALPIAALAGGMSAFAALNRSGEMVAIRAAGVSLPRLFAMALPVFLTLSLATALLAEVAVPRSQARFQSWWASTQASTGPEPRWFRIDGDIVRVQAASADGTRLDGISIYRRGEDGLLAERIVAAHAIARSESWRLEDVSRTQFGDSQAMSATYARLEWRSSLQADDVRRFFAGVPQISAGTARRSLDSKAPVSLGDAVFETRIARSFAEPVAPVIMLLLCLPIAFVDVRRRRAWLAIAYAAGGALLYLVADGALSVSAQAGLLPPLLGALAAPLLGLLIGWTVLLYSGR